MSATPPLLSDEGEPSSGSPLHVGQIVSGKYRIERQIGRGGMGIVLAATHVQLGHLVALKVMRRELVADDKALDRLLMEARAAAKIRSEHVARVLDVGMLENGSPFIVMEYLEGENLADLLDRQGALGVEQAASFLLQCCLALAEVHVAEMVHRDLKPGNIFIARQLDGSPTVKIVDFGISKQIGEAGRHGGATTSPQVLGSPYYMAPEQMRAGRVDERSDLWGLGAILFEMLTGRPPFLGDTLPEVYAAVLNHTPPALGALRPGIPDGLDDIVQRCLQKEPARRFGDVAGLAEALAPFAGAAAQHVERVVRILSNPDAARARYSVFPAPEEAPGAEPPLTTADSGARVMPPALIDSGNVLRASLERGADASLPGPGTEPERSAPAPLGSLHPPVQQTALEAGFRPSLSLPLDPPLPSSWPSAGPESGFGAVASGDGNVPGLRSGNGKWVVAGLAAVAGAIGGLVLFWPSAGPEVEAVAPRVETRALVPSADPPAAEPRIAPFVEAAPSASEAARAVVEAARSSAENLQAEPSAEASQARAPRPAPRRKPRAPKSNVDPGSRLWTDDRPSQAGDSRTGRTGRGEISPDDAWNPELFGDRR